MKLVPIKEESRVDEAFKARSEDKYYYFVSETNPEYQPIIYGVTSASLIEILVEYWQRLLNGQRN